MKALNKRHYTSHFLKNTVFASALFISALPLYGSTLKSEEGEKTNKEIKFSEINHGNTTESDLVLEDWMTSPFDWALQENELVVEPWMEAPFESGLREPEPVVESWMTRPFELDVDIRIESWMTRPF